MTQTFPSSYSATEIDLPSVIDIHIAAFPGFFLTSLGPSFLRAMYGAFLSNKGSIFVVGGTDNRAQGFAVGLIKSEDRDRSLALRTPLQFLIAVIPALLRNPANVANRLWTQFWARGEKVAIPEDAAILRSIGVLPEVKGQGLADELLKHFEILAFTRGARTVALTTDAIDNQRAIAFYSKNGYSIKQKFHQDKSRLMLLMTKELN